nr:DUF502 domain-containing protein [Legionellales bacterium]
MRIRRRRRHAIRRFIIAGLLLWLPLAATFLVVRLLVDTMDKTLALLPAAYQPEVLLGFRLPGLGIVLALVIVLVTGILVTNFLGRRLLHLWEAIIDKIPLVNTIYKAVKQVSETVLAKQSQSFRKVLLIEYPRRGLWSIVFKTGDGVTEVSGHVGEPMVTVFLPTTPNPTSGFLMLVPAKDALELSISVEDALKMIISLGVVHPKNTFKTI